MGTVESSTLMKCGPLFIGWCDYGMAFGIILRLPRWAWRYKGNKA